jgi:hypothetical protein
LFAAYEGKGGKGEQLLILIGFGGIKLDILLNIFAPVGLVRLSSRFGKYLKSKKGGQINGSKLYTASTFEGRRIHEKGVRGERWLLNKTKKSR